MSTRYVAYYRVSTREQGDSGLGLEAQRTAVRHFLGIEEGAGTPSIRIDDGAPFSGTSAPRSGKHRAKTQGGPIPPSGLLAEIEEQESGNNNERPALAEALRLCRMYHATLIIAKLDRLSRNVAFLDAVSRSRVKFVAVDVPDMDEMKLSILSFVAQIERQMISARTKAALAAARARGVQLGRPPGKHPQPVHLAKKASAASVASRQATARERCIDFRREVAAIREDGITTWAGIAAALNDAGFRAPRGGQWSATQVLRTMKYCEEVK